MRRKQVKWVSYSYLAGNMLVFVELTLAFAVKNNHVGNCVETCANPHANGAAMLLLSFAVCQLVPTHFFLISFYIIPRKFIATVDDDIDLTQNERGNLQTPLLDSNLNAVGENMNWREDRSTKEGSVVRDDNYSAFSGRLSGSNSFR